MDHQTTRNLHSNWKDLNPIWDQRRHERAVECSKRYLACIAKKLKEKVEIEDIKNFTNFVTDGGKLTYSDIKSLNSKKKNIYTKQLIKECDYSRQYVNSVI